MLRWVAPCVSWGFIVSPDHTQADRDREAGMNGGREDMAGAEEEGDRWKGRDEEMFG